MFNTLICSDVNSAFSEIFWKIRLEGREQNSRNGKVITFTDPLCFAMRSPSQRVLLHPERDANPFFHVIEALWMFAGLDEVHLLTPYNKKYVDYAEPNGEVHGAYGHRWRTHFEVEQITTIVRLLKKNPEDRRTVMGMWDPECDLGVDKKDVPCNTHIYFRVVGGKLDMTVCNRSNDVVWGMLGANVVHMTMLQELVALAIGMEVGTYRVFTQNAHVYEQHWHWVAAPPMDSASFDGSPLPLMRGNETVTGFQEDSQRFFLPGNWSFEENHWIHHVAAPMKKAWHLRQEGLPYKYKLAEIACPQWRQACEEWCARREK